MQWQVRSYLYFSARSAGVSPSGVFASILAPISTSSLTTSLCPCAAARCRGVPAYSPWFTEVQLEVREGRENTDRGAGEWNDCIIFRGNCWHALTLVPAERLQGGLELNQDLDCVALAKLCFGPSGSRIEGHAVIQAQSSHQPNRGLSENVERMRYEYRPTWAA